MGKGRYKWGLELTPPPLGEHSKSKHAVFREYLKRYLRELTKTGRISHFRLNVVDAFCGGGVYTDEKSADPYYGSPVILIETLQDMQVELQSKRTQPFLLDWRVHLVDSDRGAHGVLRKVLADKGLLWLLGDRVFLHHATAQQAMPGILADVTGRGSTIFILDQYGYTAVPFAMLQDIFRTLPKPEVILTFAYEQLARWVQDYDRLARRLANMGLGELSREEFDMSMKHHGGREFLIQRTLNREFLAFAKYYTPFFVVSRKSNTAFWLVHLSMHSRARDVMTGLHWQLQNRFAHFGGAGQNMLGFDPANPPPDAQPYLFDDDAKSRTMWRMQEDLPPLLHAYKGGVEFRQFFADIANGSPADSAITREALIGLAELGAVEIRTAAGGEKRSIASLGPTDRLMIPAQPTFLLAGRPPPLFARQPQRVTKALPD